MLGLEGGQEFRVREQRAVRFVDRFHDVVEILELTRAENLGMAGEDLLHERAPGARHAQNKERDIRGIAETRLALKLGALELLDTLDQFRLPRAIATSSSRRTVERHLTAHNLMGRFAEIVGRGDYERGKPAPDPYLKAAQQLGVEPYLCLALEDSHNGIRSASSAGMMTIMVPDHLEPTDEIRGLCAFVVRDLYEVRSLILAA